MCVVSMVMDEWAGEWSRYVPNTGNIELPPNPMELAIQAGVYEKMIEAAKEYDKKTGQPNCELDEKRKAIKEIAKQLGVEVAFL